MTRESRERVGLPGSPRSIPNSLPEILQLGLDWNEMDVIEAHYPAAERLRVQRVREVNLFSSEEKLREFGIHEDASHELVSQSTRLDLGLSHVLEST